MKIGSKVRFLNGVGGGTVTKINGDDIIVSDEDSWDWPVKRKDVVEILIDSKTEKRQIVNSTSPKNISTKRKATTPSSFKEIDLHGEKLCGCIKDPVSIHIRQKAVVISTLECEKNHHGKKIVFIHGKGEGILRSEIISELQKRKKYFEFEDAPFDRYGFQGALKVTVK